ncbi:MAG: OsmC family peroxiredoxin [SAR202 cluster bacterium]|nr:OsmC family peroxiredoxin [SAR202 cluster bacterium]
MAAIREASTHWEGPLMGGKGTVSAITSGVFKLLPVSWVTRSEQAANGQTSPEELVAAAHSACFSMALSGALARANTPPTALDVTAKVTFDRTDAGFRVTSSELTVVGKVPGIDQAAFEKAAEGAKDGCPISQALKGNVRLSVKAKLAS